MTASKCKRQWRCAWCVSFVCCCILDCAAAKTDGGKTLNIVESLVMRQSGNVIKKKKKARLRNKLEILDVCPRAPQNSAVLSRTFGLWHVMVAPTFVINGVCLFFERGFAQTPQLNASLSQTKGCANITQGGKKKKRNDNVQIIPKLGLILYMEFSSTPSSIPSFPRFLSPLPITFSRRIKKRASWMSRSISFSYKAARIQGNTPPWLVLSSLPPLILFLPTSRVRDMGV